MSGDAAGNTVSAGVVVDTCVLSEVRHPKGNARVKRRFAACPAGQLYLSVLAVGEARKGIHRLPPGPQRTELEAWAAGVRRTAAGRVLDVTQAVALRWGELVGEAMRRGRQVPPIDGLMAATALHHGMRVMTRNTPDFEAAGVAVLDPWSDDWPAGWEGEPEGTP